MPKYGVTIATIKGILKGGKIAFTSDYLDPTAAPYTIDDTEVSRLIDVAEAKLENRFSRFYVTPLIGYDVATDSDQLYTWLPISTRMLIEEILIWQTIIDLFQYYSTFGDGITDDMMKRAESSYKQAEGQVFNYKAGGILDSTPLDGLKQNKNLYNYQEGTPKIAAVQRADAQFGRNTIARMQNPNTNTYWAFWPWGKNW